VGNISWPSRTISACRVWRNDGNTNRVAQRQMNNSSGFHIWRWRILGAWVIFFTLLVAWSLHNQGNEAQHGITLAKQNIIANVRQEKTIRLLCNDLYLLNNLVIVQITANEIKLQDHIKNNMAKQAEADTYIIRNFQQFSKEISSQLTDKDSPCVSS